MCTLQLRTSHAIHMPIHLTVIGQASLRVLTTSALQASDSNNGLPPQEQCSHECA